MEERYYAAPAWQKEIWGTNHPTEHTLNVIREELAANNISAGGDGFVKRGTAAQAWCVFKKNTH